LKENEILEKLKKTNGSENNSKKELDALKKKIKIT